MLSNKSWVDFSTQDAIKRILKWIKRKESLFFVCFNLHLFKDKGFLKNCFPSPLILEPAKFGQQSRESWLEHEPVRGQWSSPGCILFRSFLSLCPGNCTGPYDLHDLYSGRATPECPSVWTCRQHTSKPFGHHQVHQWTRIIKQGTALQWRL